MSARTRLTASGGASDELVDLGLLRTVRFDVYALRSPNVLQILGGRDEIGRRYEEAQEQVWDPSAEGHGRRFLSTGFASPLTNQQESLLISPSNGVCIVAGLKVAGIGDVADAIRSVGGSVLGSENVRVENDIMSVGSLRYRIAGEFDRKREGLELSVVPTELPWGPEWVKAADEIFARKASRSKFLRLVFLADATQAWEWICSAERTALVGRIGEIGVEPWTRAVLNQWIDVTGIPLRIRPGEALSLTGAWGPVFKELATRASEGLNAIPSFLHDLPAGLPAGLAQYDEVAVIEPAAPVIRVLLEMGEALSRDILLDFTGIEDARLTPILQWGELLGLLRSGEAGYDLDPLFRKARSSLLNTGPC
jgi:hypothetical protein